MTAYYACKVLMTSNLTSKYNARNVYMTLIRPVVTHKLNLDIFYVKYKKFIGF